MGKCQTNCSLDEDLKREALERGLSFSEILTQGVRLELDPDKEIERLECRKTELLTMLGELEDKLKNVRNRKAEKSFVETKEDGRWDEAVAICVEAYHRLGEVPVRSIEHQAKVANCTQKELKEAMFKKLSEEVEQ
jgi:hypothetical protein